MAYFWNSQYVRMNLPREVVMLSPQEISKLAAIRPTGLSDAAQSLAIDVDVTRQSMVGSFFFSLNALPFAFQFHANPAHSLTCSPHHLRRR